MTITDCYIYSPIARAIGARADPDWIRRVYSFSLKPDAVFYLRIEAEDLVPRILQQGGFDYWESGMDIPMGVDHYESFIRYQRRVIEELDGLGRDFEFDTIDATQEVDEIPGYVCSRVSALLESDASAPDAVAAST